MPHVINAWNCQCHESYKIKIKDKKVIN